MSRVPARDSFEAIAVAVDLHDVRVIKQSVEQCGGERGIVGERTSISGPDLIALWPSRWFHSIDHDFRTASADSVGSFPDWVPCRGRSRPPSTDGEALALRVR